MSVFDRIKSLLGVDTEPRWKRRPEFYYRCPECEEIAVNSMWQIRDVETGGVVYTYNGKKHFRKELHYLCPKCDELIPFDDVHSLDEIAHFKQKIED